MSSTVTQTPASDAVELSVDGVLATVAEALTTLHDLRHEQVIMAAAVLTARHGIVAHEAVEMASYDCWGDTAKAAWAEAGRLLDNARVEDE